MRTLISSGSHLEAPIGFSRAVRIGDHIAVAGTAPIKDRQTVFHGDPYQQTLYCLKLSVNAVIEAGGKAEYVIRTRIMLTDINDWKQAARAPGELFQTIRPACTFVEAKGFIEPDWLVETEMDAIVQHD